VIDVDAADQRADDGGHGEGGGDVALVAPALARGDESPTVAMASVIRPPAAAPGLRAAMSCVMSPAAHTTRTRRRRGAARPGAACARAVAELAPHRGRRGGGDDVGVTTHETSLRLPRSPAMTGSAVARSSGQDRGQHREDDGREGHRHVDAPSEIEVSAAGLPGSWGLLRHDSCCPNL
jgi:hypothetical protein